MTPGRIALAEAIQRAASDLPLPLAENIAAVIEANGTGSVGALELAMQHAVPQLHYGRLALGVIKAWKTDAPELGAQSVAFGLLTAARIEEHVRRDQRLELVWTLPDVATVSPRQPEQALLQVIDSATDALIVVSFVAYKVPAVADAVARAVRRGVAVRLILEDPDVSQGKVAFGALGAIGQDVASGCDVYVWPAAQGASKTESGCPLNPMIHSFS